MCLLALTPPITSTTTLLHGAQRIHGAIRRGLYSWPNVQYHIHKTTAVDFAEMRGG